MKNTRIGKAAKTGAIAVLALMIAGCTHNPLLGKWSIASREKEVDASYLDELTSNVRRSTGATTIEFRKDSILISGGPQEHTETGIRYIITELEGGATDVQIVQRRKSDPNSDDVDVCHIDSKGDAASLESRNEILHLTRIGQ
jgi:hypothetical protein